MVILEVRNLNQSVAMPVMMDGLLKNDFKKLLVKTYPRDYFDLLVPTEKYARMEEVFTEEASVSSIATEQNKERSPTWEGRTYQRSQCPFQK